MTSVFEKLRSLDGLVCAVKFIRLNVDDVLRPLNWNATFNGKDEKNNFTDCFYLLYNQTDLREGTDALNEGICRVSVRHFRFVKNSGHWNKRYGGYV